MLCGTCNTHAEKGNVFKIEVRKRNGIYFLHCNTRIEVMFRIILEKEGEWVLIEFYWLLIKYYILLHSFYLWST